MQNGMLKNTLILGAGAMAFAYSQMASHAEREDMIAFYQLENGEPEAYDTCQSALSDKELKNGGSKAEFCGCFAKKATTKLNASHKRDAGHVLNLIADKRLAELDTAVSPAAYEGLAGSSVEVTLDIMGAFSTCNDEVTATCPKDDTDCLGRIQERLERHQEFAERREHIKNSAPDETEVSAAETSPTHAPSPAADAEAPTDAAAAPEAFGNLLPGG